MESKAEITRILDAQSLKSRLYHKEQNRLVSAGAEIAWELPADRTPACMLQQQLSEKAPQAVNKATHRAWAQEYGVICLSGASTFFTIDGADQPQFWPPDSLRQALKPSGARLRCCACASHAFHPLPCIS